MAIAWHQKYEGILDLFGMRERVCGVRDLESRDLSSQFSEFWERCQELRSRIGEALPAP